MVIFLRMCLWGRGWRWVLLYSVTLLSRLICEEFLNPVGLFLERTQRAENRLFQMLAIRQRSGIEPLSFGYAPDFFARIEFRGVAGQIMQRQPLSTFSNKIFDGFRSVGWGSIDNQKQFLPEEMSVKRLQKSDERSGIEVASGELEKQMSMTTYRRGNPHVNSPLTRDADNGFEVGESPGLPNMRNQNKKPFVSIEKNPFVSSTRAENSQQDFLFPFAHRLGILFQGAGFGNFLYKSQSAKKSWHMFGMKRNTEQFSNQDSDTRPRPQIRPKTVATGWMMQNMYKSGEMRGFEFRLGSRGLGRPQTLQAGLPEPFHPSKDRGTVESHGMRDVFDTDSAFGHSYRHKTHLFQDLMIDSITVDSIGDRHANSVSWNLLKVYLIMLHNINSSPEA